MPYVPLMHKLLQRQEVNIREMRNEPEDKNLNRGRVAATRWLPMSAIGAAYSLCHRSYNGTSCRTGFDSCSNDKTLVFSGLFFGCSRTAEKDNIRVRHKKFPRLFSSFRFLRYFYYYIIITTVNSIFTEMSRF